MAKQKPVIDLLDQAEAAGELIGYSQPEANGEAPPPKEKRKPDGGRIVKDKELVAMQDASDLLDDLDEPMRRRVVQWIADRYGHLIAKPKEGS